MFTWFFMTLLICIAAYEEELFTFTSQDDVLTDCIKHHLAIIDDQNQSTSVLNDLANLAAIRFHGKSMSSYTFNERFRQFSYKLRNKVLNHKKNKKQLSKQLQAALKQALIICADERPLSAGLQIQSEEMVSFSSNEDFLFDCIKNHLKLTGRWEFNLEDGFTEFIATRTAKKYYDKSLLKKNFYKNIQMLFHNLRVSKKNNNASIDQLSYELELSVVHAVEDCAIDGIHLAAVPIFEIEPTETAHLLNLILVKWSNSLRNMIQSKNGRKLLRRYVSDAWIALMYELNVCQNNTQVFRLALRSFWKNRAQEIYDGNSVEQPHIQHRFTLNYPVPHMVLSDVEKFMLRRNKKFNDRNPLALRSNVNEILNIHTPAGPYNISDIDIFDYYVYNGMTSADYYFENQINQFYRIIFFFLELHARGISTDRDDSFYDGPLPDGLIPEQIQAIIYDDDAYRDYLLDERYFFGMLMGNDTQNEIARSLFESARVLEENLILLRSNVPCTNNLQLNGESQSETTASPTTTTTQSLKRKDDVWKNKSGKCFSRKRPKSTSSLDNSGSTSYSETSNLNIVTNSPLLGNPNFFDNLITTCPELNALLKLNEIDSNYYGYLMFRNDSSHQMKFS